MRFVVLLDFGQERSSPVKKEKAMGTKTDSPLDSWSLYIFSLEKREEKGGERCLEVDCKADFVQLAGSCI